MKLADDITIEIGGETITLHPSLWHAIRLARRVDSFDKLVRGVIDGNLTIACAIIIDHADMDFLENHVFDALPDLREPLLDYILACAGIDPEELSPDKCAKGTPVPLAEQLAGLYRIGTGWLGWTPADTLDATPAEITEAHKGRLEMLKAIFGDGEKTKPSTSDTPTTPDQLSAQMKFIFRARAKADARAAAKNAEA